MSSGVTYVSMWGVPPAVETTVGEQEMVQKWWWGSEWMKEKEEQGKGAARVFFVLCHVTSGQGLLHLLKMQLFVRS